jgi:hypothetical protein
MKTIMILLQNPVYIYKERLVKEAAQIYRVPNFNERHLVNICLRRSTIFMEISPLEYGISLHKRVVCVFRSALYLLFKSLFVSSN